MDPARVSSERGSWPEAAVAVLACAVAFVALGVLFLNPYVVRNIHLPVGFDATYYIVRSNQVTVVGLEHIGLIRSGSPLLFAVLMSVSGQTAFTLVAWVPAILTFVGGLGVAAMLRAALDIKAWWIPVAAVLTWTGFGNNTMVSVHLDNLLNAALMLAGIGAAVSAVRWRRGLVAATLLFAAAALTHWPFYALAMGAFVPAVILLGRAEIGGWLRGGPFPRETGRLLAPAAVSGAVAGASLLAAEPGVVGFRLKSALLRRRFLVRLYEPFRYFTLPLAVGGAVTTLRLGPRPLPPARRFFLYLMGTWTAVTVLGGILQLIGLPTAGGRLLNYFFPLTILSAAFLWHLVGWLRSRLARPVAAVAGVAIVGSVLAGSFALTWTLRGDVAAWLGADSILQVSRAEAYISRWAPRSPLVFVVGPVKANRWWSITRTVLSPESVLRAERAIVPTERYPELAAGNLASVGPLHPDAVVIATYMANRDLFPLLRARHRERVIAPGVAILRGPVPTGRLPAAHVPRTSTAPWTIAKVTAFIVLALFVAGGGWAEALVPRDWVARVCLAPALGVATIILVALGWDALSLSFASPLGWGPFLVAAAAGWILAVWTATRRRQPRPTAGDRPAPSPEAMGAGSERS